MHIDYNLSNIYFLIFNLLLLSFPMLEITSFFIESSRFSTIHPKCMVMQKAGLSRQESYTPTPVHLKTGRYIEERLTLAFPDHVI